MWVSLTIEKTLNKLTKRMMEALLPASQMVFFTKCQLNQNEMCRDSCVPIWNEEVIFVFVGLYYDDMKHKKITFKFLDFCNLFAFRAISLQRKELPDIRLYQNDQMFLGIFRFLKYSIWSMNSFCLKREVSLCCRFHKEHLFSTIKCIFVWQTEQRSFLKLFRLTRLVEQVNRVTRIKALGEKLQPKCSSFVHNPTNSPISASSCACSSTRGWDFQSCWSLAESSSQQGQLLSGWIPAWLSNA